IPSVGTRTNTGNSFPTVSGGANYIIPTNTPFALTATGSDANGDTIYYSWEEADLGAATNLNTADNGSSPLFRVYSPTTSPTRTFPQLASILSGTNSTAAPAGSPYLVERLPTTSRTMKFVITARDQHAGGGGTNVLSGSPVNVTSVSAASGFGITNFSTASTVAGGSNQTITWNVAGTTGNGINTSQVNILMSTDGGTTFPITLAAATAND
ncbi:MAG: C-terminal target protein, partial [Phycisphaerales bacterium]|nr:C-terminal target protein [Phycisphaerales bacterium]